MDFKITILIVVIITICQIIAFYRTSKRQYHFKKIFPNKIEDKLLVLKHIKDNSVQISTKQSCNVVSKEEKIKESIKNKNAEIDKILKKIKTLERHREVTTDIYAQMQFTSEIDAQQKYINQINNSISEEKKQLQALKDQLNSISNLKAVIGNDTMINIISSINSYLEKNKNSVADFSIIKDIIDRNTDAVEEEIQSQIPIPIFFGLMGTMLGIIIGAGDLVFSEALEHLLTPFAPDPGVEFGSQAYYEAYNKYNTVSTNGINSLFGGVAIATFSSIFGIILNVISTYVGKDIKYSVESKKHAFLSWLQAELLPKISSDFSSALIKLGNDLTEFNNSFSTNAILLKKTISEIGYASSSQAKLLQTIEQLDVSQIATANIRVYEELKNCTHDMANLAQDLKSIQQSIRNIGNFMQDGINEYEKRNTYIQDASGKVDIAINEGHKKLNQATTTIFEKYDALLNTLYINTEKTTKELENKHEKEVERLHNAIVEKFSDVKRIEEELKNLVAVKTSMSNLEKATATQNQKIDSLTQAIRELAQIKVSGGTTQVEMKMPKFYKAIIIIATTIISLTGLFFITLRILEMFDITL